jgi:hypothetical protein
MKIFRFDTDVRQPITQYSSAGASIARIAQLQGDFRIDCIALDRDGILGYHQASLEQLFLVVRGDGAVRGEPDEWLGIYSGQAAFWKSGEWHETRTESGLTAIVIEGAGLDPFCFMEEVA